VGSCTLVDLRHLGGIDVVDEMDFKKFIIMLKTWMLRNCWWEREMTLGRKE